MTTDEKAQTRTKLQAAQRHNMVLEQLGRAGFVTVPEMASLCNVSEMTMRRDLDYLTELGKIERTHGGAVSLDRRIVSLDLVEPQVSARSTVNADGKAVIARAAAALVSPGQTIALDVGTTAHCLASNLVDMPVNIHTSSLHIATTLAERKPKVFLPGGQVAGSEPTLVGPQAVRNFGELCFDFVFIGASGVSSAGFYDYSLEDTHVKRALIEGSQKIVVLLDSTKFDRMSVARVCTFDEVDLLITDAPPPADLMDLLEAAGVEVQIAQ